MATLRKLLLSLALVASTVAVPVSQREQCARYCTDGSDFSLSPGSTYHYDYETTAVTTVQGSSQDKTQLQMTAHADIQVLSKCDLSLRLRGVVLKLSDPESPEYLVSAKGVREFARTLESAVLRFSFQNGQVEHVCPSEGVEDWVTNIHRGVLSAFQTYIVKPDWTTRTQETDILGKCTAEYHSLGKSWQGLHTIRKMKDLGSCTDREDVQTFMQGTPYAQDFSKSLPVLKGTQECEQAIGDGFLQSSSCHEKLVFRPFSGRGHGVVTAVTQKLTYATTSERTFTGNDYRPSTQPLLYKHAPHMAPSTGRPEEEAESALSELCEASKVDITVSVPRKFSLFVYKLKNLNHRSLKTFFHKTEKICPGNTKARKFFLDAIPLVSTSDSARFMFDMMSTNAISDAESNLWLTSLTFITEPTPEMILTFTPLLDGRFDQAILGVSSLIRNYCSGKDCSNVPEVQTAVHKLFENLGENCFGNEDKKVILSLKAISNIGNLFGKRRTLEACYKNPQIRTEARLAAIEAFRRVSCEVSRDDLLNTYKNYDEETEIRIAAYLAVMKCPSPSKIEAVKNTMTGEKINHVGSFVWTHLNALSRTRHPERQAIRDILSDLYLLNKFASDARKFSSAHEATYFIEALDSGLHADSHLVFSTESYLPRTAMLNLTVDIFGKTCNLFQIDGRMEGMEHLVEKFFGPSGYFPQKNVAKILREKRSVDNNKLERISSQFNEHRAQYEPYGSLDVKIFGTSMWYNQFRQNEDGKPKFNFLDIVTKLAQEQEQEYSRSFMFLDTTFTVPMASGLPLKIALNGTASVALKIGGKFDVKSFERVDVAGHIEPSGAIEIASLLTVAAGNVARSGMRVVSTMHSSSLLDGKLEVRNGEVVKAQLNMPRERIDIFNIESKVYLLHGPEEREKKTRRKETTQLKSCTGESVSTLFGVKLCTELDLPPYRPNAPLHPLSGAARFNIFVQKTDPALKSYNFEAQWKAERKNGGLVRVGVLAMNTPNSQTDRDVKVEVHLNQAEHTATLKLKTPIKKLGATAKLLNEDSHKKLNFGVTMDDKDLFSLQSELKRSSDDNGVTYTPSLEIRVPSKRLTYVTGSANLRHGQRYTGQLQVEDLTEKPILAKVNMEIGKRDRHDLEMSLSSFALDGTVKGYAQLGDTMSSRVTTEYRIMEGKMNKLSVVGKLRNLSANALTKYTGLLNIQASVLPEWNTELQIETMKTTGHIENTVSISLGDGVRSRVHTIKMQEIVRYEGSLADNKVAASLSLAYPEKNIDYAMSINHENTDRSLKNKLQLQYDANKQIKTDVELKIKSDNLINLAGDMKLSYPGRNTGLVLEISQPNQKEYRGTVTCQWEEGKKVSTVVHYKDKCEGSRLKYEVDGNVVLPANRHATFSSTIGYHGGQFAGLTELSLGADKYRTKVDITIGNGLNHRLISQLVLKNNAYGLDAAIANVKGKLSCNAELKMPYHHRATAKFEGRLGESLKVGHFETYWDADRDANKRFMVSGELKDLNDGYDVKVNMQVLRRTVRAIATTGLQGQLFSSEWKTNNKVELQWSPTEIVSVVLSSNVLLDRSRQQINSHIEFASPYSGYENVTLSVTHLAANQQWNSEIASTLPMGNSIILSSFGKYAFVRGVAIDTTAKIQTTYRGLEEMYLKLSHDHNFREISNKGEVKWGTQKKVQYLLSGRRQASVLTGIIRFNSPFSKFENISGAINLDSTGGNYKTRGEVRWTHAKQVTFNLVGNTELSGRRRICSINYDGTSPFRGYENTAAKLVYSNDGITINTEAETVWNRNKITSSLSVSARNQFFNKNMEGKFQLSTPFRNFENFQVSTSLEANQNSYKINVDSQLSHGSKASLNSQGKFIDFNDMEFNAVVMNTFTVQPQRASIDFVHKMQNSKLRSTFDASAGSDRLTVLVIGLAESSYNSRNIEFSATVNTPFYEYQEIKTEFTHNQKGNEYFSKLNMNKNKLSGSLTHKLNVRDVLNFATIFEVSFSNFPTTKVSVTQSSNGRQLDHNSYVMWSKNKKVHLTAQFVDKSRFREALVKITTPYSIFREVEVKANTECQDWDHKGMISVVWDKMNKMALSGDFKVYTWESFTSQLEFTSPFKGHEFYSTSVKYDLTAPQKEAEASFLWDVSKRQAVVAKVSFLRSYHLTNFEMRLTTPFEDFERTGFTAKYDNRPPEKSVNVLYERGWRKINFVVKTLSRSNSAEISVDLSSPYEYLKEISASAKYNKLKNGMSSELNARLNKNYKYTTISKYEITDTSVEGKMSVTTPIRNYEVCDLEVSGNYQGPQITSKLNLSCNTKKIIEFDSDLYFSPKRGVFSFNLKSPFEDYKSMNLLSKYSATSGKYEGELKITFNSNKNYVLSLKTKYGGANLAEIQVNLDTPYSPFKTVQLILSVDANPEMYQLLSTLEWENKKADVHFLLNKKIGRFYEAKIKVDTPFEDFRALSLESSMRNDKNKFIDGRVILVTPFDFLRKFDTSAEFKNDDAGSLFTVKVESPINLKVEGKLANSQFRPLSASLDVEAPYMTFRKVSTTAEINMLRWNHMNAEISTKSHRFEHSLSFVFEQNDKTVNLKIKPASSHLPFKSAEVLLNADYADMARVKVEGSLQTMEVVHFFNARYNVNGKSMEVNLNMESPLLPERKAETVVKYNRRRFEKSIDVSLVVPSSTHRVTAKYENKGNELSSAVKVDSALLPFLPLDAQAKYANNNGQDIGASLAVSTPVSNHAISGSLKNYEGEKFAQLKIECPMSRYTNPFMITGALKHQGYNTADASLSVSTPEKEIRIAGKMKNTDFKDIEAFLTLNTPFEVLKMARLDGRFKNDRFQNVDCSFQLETSNKNFPSLGLTSKLSRTSGSEEMSLMLRLPLRNPVQLLGNVHYNPDYSSADSRVTISLPGSKYVAYGQYGLSKSRVSGHGEIEIDDAKWIASGRLERSADKKDIYVSFITPSAETYTAGGAYGGSGTRRDLALAFTAPSNNRYGLNSSMTYDNPTNFELEYQIETPLYKYGYLQGRIQQRYTSRHLSTHIEYSGKADTKGYLKFHHTNQRDGLKGSFQVRCPYTGVKDLKASYNRVRKSLNIEDSFELDYNRAKQLKMEVILFGERSSHVVLEVPVLPMTVTADIKRLANGREVNFKSTYLSRIMAFRTSYQNDASQITHDAALTWDERHEKRVSYDFKLTNTDVGKELWSRLDTPIRSLMMKGNFTNTSRTRSGGVDMYWDASRSLEKHMAAGFAHTDISTDRQTSHRLQFILEHPKLTKQIVQTNIFTISPSEILAKSELQYTRDQLDNFLLEFRANDMTRSSRENHYKGELNVRHPVSWLDIRATAEVIDSRLESHAQLKLTTLDRTRQQNVREIKAKIMKLRKEIEVMTRLNEAQTTFTGQVQTGRGGDLELTAERKTNEKRDLSAKVKLSKRERSFDATLLDAENAGYVLSASCPKNSVSLKVSHTHQGNEVTDAEMYLGLEQSKIIRSRINWRPIRSRDLKLNGLKSYLRNAQSSYRDWTRDMAEEVSTRLSLLSTSLSDAVSPLLEDLKAAAFEIQNDLKATNGAFNKMYHRNEFFMKDIVREAKEMKQVLKEIVIGLSLGCEVLYNITVEQVEEVYYTIYYTFVDFGEYLQKVYARMMVKASKAMRSAQIAVMDVVSTAERALMKKMKQVKDSIMAKVNQWLKPYEGYIVEGYYRILYAAEQTRSLINGFGTSVTNIVVSNPYFTALKNYGTSIVNTFRALRDLEFTQSAQAFLDRVYEAQIMDSIVNHPSVEYMSSYANAALSRSIELYHNLGIDVAVSTALDSATKYAKALAIRTAQDLLSDLYKAKAGAKYDFAPERGLVSLEFNLPTPRDSLVKVFDFKSYPEYEKVKTMHTVAAEYYEDFSFWDVYYKVVKYFTPAYWLPAFNTHAILSGNQHYITFDGLDYDFAGRCSYLLARDFVDGNFTALVNYGSEDHRRRSLTFLLDGGRKVDVGMDGKVTLDDMRAESPLQIGGSVVMREGSNVRVENEKKGFSIICNLVHNYCRVSLSGFYFGKTGGLFGTFNHEPSLDRMTPDRYLREDVESFARSWEVGQSVCRSTENLATLPSNGARVQYKCRNLFEKNTSEFRACFKQVNPEPYLRMCVSDLSAKHERDHGGALCDSAAAYFVECKAEGVALKMPTHCVRCEKQDGTHMTEGQSMQFPKDGAVTAADVVFLVEEKECNRDRVKYLTKLAQGIEDNFRNKGYKEVRYSVVGFGGDNIHSAPHIHTMEGKQSGPLRSLEPALDSLEYGDGPINILEAMRFAAALNYRPGTTKSFVLVKCSICKSEEVRAEYSEMLRTLIDGDITLHLLMEQKYEMKVANKNAKARRVIGVDKRLAYTLKDVKDTRLSGDGDLLAQLRIPKDVCIPMAFETGGSSFDSHFLSETKKSTNKKFVDVLARLVVRSSAEATDRWGLCCECIATEDGVGQSVCQRCVSAEMATMVSADTSVVITDYSETRNAPRSRVRKHESGQ